MKRVIALLMAVGLSATALAQQDGTLVFDHYTASGVSGQVLLPDGSPAMGTGYSGQLYAGAVGGALSPVLIGGNDAPAYPFYGAARAGYLNTSFVAVQVSGVQPGTLADVQLRVWDNNGGALTDWTAAEAGATVWGLSDIVPTTAGLGGPDPAGGPAFTAPSLPGIPSFPIVPEPGTW